MAEPPSREGVSFGSAIGEPRPSGSGPAAYGHMSTDYLAGQVPAQAPTPPAERIPPPQRPAPAGKPWYRQPRAWGEAVLIALLFAMTALFAVTLSSLGHAHGQVGKLQSQYAASQALNGKLQSQYAASQAENGRLARDLAAQQGKALVGAWTRTSNGKTYTWTFKADHTEIWAGVGWSYTGYWAIGKPGQLIEVLLGSGPAFPASEGGKKSDLGYAETFTIDGDTLTVTYASGTTETYTRSSGAGVLGDS